MDLTCVLGAKKGKKSSSEISRGLNCRLYIPHGQACFENCFSISGPKSLSITQLLKYLIFVASPSNPPVSPSLLLFTSLLYPVTSITRSKTDEPNEHFLEEGKNTMGAPPTCFLLFSTSGSFQPPCDPGPLSLAPMSPYARPRLHPMSFLLRVVLIQAKSEREREDCSLLSSCSFTPHTFTDSLYCGFNVNTPSPGTRKSPSWLGF